MLFATLVLVSPSSLISAETRSVEGVAAIAGGSLNPPSPVDGCNKAKQDAVQKASIAGFKNLVKWDRLSTDSDCKLTTTSAGSAGFYYIFTVKGVFSK